MNLLTQSNPNESKIGVELSMGHRLSHVPSTTKHVQTKQTARMNVSKHTSKGKFAKKKKSFTVLVNKTFRDAPLGNLKKVMPIKKSCQCVLCHVIVTIL